MCHNDEKGSGNSLISDGLIKVDDIRHMSTYQGFLRSFCTLKKENDCLNFIVNGDGTRIYHFTSETKRMFLEQTNSNSLKKLKFKYTLLKIKIITSFSRMERSFAL